MRCALVRPVAPVWTTLRQRSWARWRRPVRSRARTRRSKASRTRRSARARAASDRLEVPGVHKPIADRIARKAGVHRDVATTASAVTSSTWDGRRSPGRSIAELRSRSETGFRWREACALSLDCARCHKTRRS